MPLSLTPLLTNTVSQGNSWSVNDEPALARLIAQVALGQSRRVSHVLRQLEEKPSKAPITGFEGARKLLCAKNQEDAYHRDGWMFQVISWVATNIEDPDRLIRAPHMIWAHKGLDGLIVEMDGDEATALVICEEKATGKPRKTIHEKVWPEFADFETGARDNEIVAEVITLLERNHGLNCDAIIETTLWEEKRAYRIAVTGTEAHLKKKAQIRLFKGFDAVVEGDLNKRRSALMVVDELRVWMEALAAKALAHLDHLENLES